ncbi:glycosyltransferase family 2 protein [Polynucleobacter paneuropaeus]|nr:glycosyltransferase family 2 protein [Polynucleobacter paneuropaeus]QWD32960.1 glycosyltransferase family 2 protein [Polynucleobacter paneuropaeus]
MVNTTVICAVWSKDPNRYELLKQHEENLNLQTVDIERIYVFDCGDSPPQFLTGKKIISSEPLSIYEAWNLAITACKTVFIMNLNLDDRLNIDAIEQLEIEITKTGANLVGGDWKICYSQDATNSVTASFPVNLIPFIKEWPPTKGTVTRLGSGTGESATFGPATLWNINCHIKIPRYPFRTADGVLIKSVADSIYWTMLKNSFHLKLHRLPLIIGNYNSHPEDQAEFRNREDVYEIIKKGVSLL